MNLYEKYETDKDAEINGVPYEVTQGIIFMLARVCERNVAYQAERAKIAKHFEKQLMTNDNPKGYQEAITRLFAKHIVKGWDGVTDREGNPLPYTVDNCVKVLTDLPDLYNELVSVAVDADQFNADMLKKTVKK